MNTEQTLEAELRTELARMETSFTVMLAKLRSTLDTEASDLREDNLSNARDTAMRLADSMADEMKTLE